jgi:glycyl-tRNA synthetase
LDSKAREIQRQLAKDGFTVEFDEAGSIGRRYARADEAGIQLGVTIDYETLNKDTVTVRDRDSWRQVRTPVSSLPRLLQEYFQGKLNFENLGTLVET